jgi:hypothetical protein
MDKRNIQSQWNSLIEQLDLNQVNILCQSIEESLKLALVDAQKEYQNIREKLKGDNGLSDLYKFIIECKANFLKSKTSDYSIIDRSYDSFLRSMNGDESERIAKVTLLFFTTFKMDILFDFKDFKKQITKEVYDYKKNEILYSVCINLIDQFNKDINIPIKLPPIENFEIDTFLSFETLRKNQEIGYKDILEKKDEISEIRDKLHKEFNLEDSETIKNLRDELFKVNTDYRNSKWKLEDSLINVECLQREKDFLYNYNLKREPLYVLQFDETVFGDNYPALKILYKFLFEYYSIDFNWSFFAYMMTLESKDILNLKTKIINKGETGYLLFKLKDFFVSHISNDYFNWLSKKITIDEQKINKSFYEGKIWDSSQNFPNQERINIINKLHDDIEGRYNKA